MNAHDQINEMLADYAMGELSEQQSSEVQTHLAECQQCKAQLKQLEAVLQCAASMSELSVDEYACESAKRAVLEAVESQEMKQQAYRPNFSLGHIWSAIMNGKKIKLTAAAVVAMAVLSGVALWLRGSPERAKWYLVPSAAAQEVTASLEKVEALVYRQQIAHGGRYNSARHLSGTWSIHYKAEDRERKDQYYGGTLVSAEWSVSEGKDLVGTMVSFEFECYQQKTEQGKAYHRDPVAELWSYVKLIDKADLILDTEIFAGRECVGFEVKSDQDENDPSELSSRIWIDVETRLPARVETHGLPITDLPGQTVATILDQFRYYVELPADIFTPEIPEGFVNAHPDQIRAAREKEEKGEMIYADVPAGLKEEIVAALNEIETATHWLYSTKVYMSRDSWRKDSYDGQGQVQRTEWYVIEKDTGKTSFDPDDENFRLTQTVVSFTDKTYKVIAYGRESHPRHPIDDIWFPVGYVDRADRILENTEIEAVECFGLEISAKKYGTNPDGMLHRLWFDVETRLPVRMEFEHIRNDGTKSVLVRDKFEWNPELPPDAFDPKIPEDFRFVGLDEM